MKIMRDPQIAEPIAQEHHRQVEGIELIAIVNYTSDSVMEAQGSIIANKYAQGLRRVGGGAHVDARFAVVYILTV